jgi:hypothetical protein
LAEKPVTPIKVINNILAIQLEFAWKFLLQINSGDVKKLKCKEKTRLMTVVGENLIVFEYKNSLL